MPDTTLAKFKYRDRQTNPNRQLKYSQTLSILQYIWMLKDKKISYSLKWKIMDTGRAYKPLEKKTVGSVTWKNSV